MYRIINENGDRLTNFKSSTFMEAFNYMEEMCPNSYIIFHTGKNIQIVWNPLWENVSIKG